MTSLRQTFDDQLGGLQQDLLRMSSVVVEMIRTGVQSIRDRNVEDARRAIDMDDTVDELNLKIENTCLHLLALQQPMARDLRVIAGALKIITDIERMGDYAVDLAKMSIRMAEVAPPPSLPKLERMAEILTAMIRETLKAFVERNPDLIQDIVNQDDEVDRLNREVHADTVELIREGQTAPEALIGGLLTSRFLERIADHCTNVCERIYYMQTGELKELH